MPERTCSSPGWLRALLAERKPFLVINFTASWAPQCTQVTNVLTILANEPANAAIEIVNVDAEAVSELSQELKITDVPTVVLFRDGSEVHRIRGANIAEITKAVSGLQQMLPPAKSESTDSTTELNTRLKNLIQQSPIMLFMKGTPAEPRCGFTKKILEILNSLNASFDTFDILSDEEVRQGLKTFSNWPTYPQLYVKGELIGGVDIVKELAETGELASILDV